MRSLLLVLLLSPVLMAAIIPSSETTLRTAFRGAQSPEGLTSGIEFNLGTDGTFFTALLGNLPAPIGTLDTDTNTVIYQSFDQIVPLGGGSFAIDSQYTLTLDNMVAQAIAPGFVDVLLTDIFFLSASQEQKLLGTVAITGDWTIQGPTENASGQFDAVGRTYTDIGVGLNQFGVNQEIVGWRSNFIASLEPRETPIQATVDGRQFNMSINAVGVPEPSPALLIGFLGVLGIWRRKNSLA